jgi:hypothetical protein
MLDYHFSGVPVARALKKYPVVALKQEPPFEVLVGPTRTGTHEAHVVLPKNPEDIDYPLAALGDLSLAADELDRMRRNIVGECRARGRSWSHIAAALGVSRQAAWERYASPDD